MFWLRPPAGHIFPGVLDIPFAAVALNHNNPRINQFFIDQRQMKGVEVIQIGAGFRRCFSALRENYVIALVGDRDYVDNGIRIEFFNKPTIIPKVVITAEVKPKEKPLVNAHFIN